MPDWIDDLELDADDSYDHVDPLDDIGDRVNGDDDFIHGHELDDGIPASVLGRPEIKTDPFPMLKKTTKKSPKMTKNPQIKIVSDTRPKLIHCGSHLIDPTDVVCITKVKKHKDLYIVKLRSNPDPNFPIWVNEADITPLIQQFNVVTADD